MKKLSPLWLTGVEKRSEDSKQFEALVRNSVQIINKINLIIEDYERRIWDKESSEESYSEGWGYLQAHRNGEKEALRKLKKLTEHLE